MNIKLEENTNSAVSVALSEPEELPDSEYSPIKPTLQRPPFTSIKELYEDSPRGGLTISGDVPLYRELTKVATNNKSNFFHKESNTVFPHQIGDFERTQLIFSTDREPKVDAVYKALKGKSTFTVSLIPASEATEGRLRTAYLSGIKELAKEKGKNYFPKPTFLKFKGIRFVNNGVEGTYIQDENSFSQLNVFDCGTWVLKTKLDMDGMDEEQFRHFSEDLIRYFNPSRLTALKLMNLKPNVDFDSESLKDTVITGALVASAFKKIDWATENISEKERLAGFPDLYLNMHTESLKEYLRILNNKPNRTKVPENLRFYLDLKAINDAGFLDEFVVETYEKVIIVPNYVTLNFPGYHQWKQERELDVDLLKKRYKINYRALPY